MKEIRAREVKCAAGSKSDNSEILNECPGSCSSVLFIWPCHFPAAIKRCLAEKYKFHMIDNYALPYPHEIILLAFTKLVVCLCPKQGVVFFTSTKYIY